MPGKTRSGSTSDSGRSPRSDGGRLKNGENPAKPRPPVANPLKPAIRRLSVKLEKIKVEPQMLPLEDGGDTEEVARNRVVVQVSDDETVDQMEENQVRMLRFVDSSGVNVTEKVLAEAREASQNADSLKTVHNEHSNIEDQVNGDLASAIELENCLDNTRQQFKEDFKFESEVDEDDSDEVKNTTDNLTINNDSNKEELRYPKYFSKENLVNGLPLLNLKRVSLNIDQACHISESETELETIYVNAKSQVIDNESPVRMARNVSSATTVDLNSPVNDDDNLPCDEAKEPIGMDVDVHNTPAIPPLTKSSTSDSRHSICASFLSDSSVSESICSAETSVVDKKECPKNSLDQLIPDESSGAEKEGAIVRTNHDLVLDDLESEDESEAWCEPETVSADDESDGSDSPISNFLEPGVPSPVKTPKKKSGEKKKRRKSTSERPKSAHKSGEKLTSRSSSGRKRSSLVRARAALETTGTDTDDVGNRTPPRPRKTALKFDNHSEGKAQAYSENALIHLKMAFDDHEKEVKTINTQSVDISASRSVGNEIENMIIVGSPKLRVTVENCNKNSNLKKAFDGSFQVKTDQRMGRSRSSNLLEKTPDDSDVETTRTQDNDKKTKSVCVNLSSCLDTSFDQSNNSDPKTTKTKDTLKRMEADTEGATGLDRSIDSDRRTRRSESSVQRERSLVQSNDSDGRTVMSSELSKDKGKISTEVESVLNQSIDSGRRCRRSSGSMKREINTSIEIYTQLDQSCNSDQKIRGIDTNIDTDFALDLSVDSDLKNSRSSEFTNQRKVSTEINTVLDLSIDSDRRTRRSSEFTKAAETRPEKDTVIDKSINTERTKEDPKRRVADLRRRERDTLLDKSVDRRSEEELRRSVPETSQTRDIWIDLSFDSDRRTRRSEGVKRLTDTSTERDISLDQSIDSDRKSRKSEGVKKPGAETSTEKDIALDQSIDSDRRTRRAEVVKKPGSEVNTERDNPQIGQNISLEVKKLEAETTRERNNQSLESGCKTIRCPRAMKRAEMRTESDNAIDQNITSDCRTTESQVAKKLEGTKADIDNVLDQSIISDCITAKSPKSMKRKEVSTEIETTFDQSIDSDCKVTIKMPENSSERDASLDQSADSDRRTRRSSGFARQIGADLSTERDSSFDQSVDSDRRTRRSSTLKGASSLDTTLDQSIDLDQRTRRISGSIGKRVQILFEHTDQDTTDTETKEVKKESKGLKIPKYKEGQIVLVKVGNYPYWAAMVRKDPESGELVKGSRIHVGFIGENTRAWVKESRMMNFVPFDEFKKRPEAAIPVKSHLEYKWRSGFRGGEKLVAMDKKTKFESIESINNQIEKSDGKRKEQQKLHKGKNEMTKLKNTPKDKSCDSPLSPPAKCIKLEPEYRRSSATLRQKEVELRKEEERKKEEAKGPAWEWVFNGYKEAQPVVEPVPKLGGFRNERCCVICEDSNRVEGKDMIKCKGPCGNTFHKKCLNLGELEDLTWKCSSCISGQHPCFICKSTESGLDFARAIKRCTYGGCNKWYHEECLTGTVLWPQTKVSGRGITCPAHICHTCASENVHDPVMKYAERLYKCLRCPTSYHQGDHCVAAGTVQITKTEIVCPKHFEPAKMGKKKGQKPHINISWCHTCGKGGSQHGILYLCEQCPGAVHRDCTEGVIPEGDLPYYCDDCESGKMPLYGEIIWAKFGSFRWWPAQVLHPTQVPDNIENRPHQMGEFPVKFLGSGDYEWINQGRVTPWNDGEEERIKFMPPAKCTSKSMDAAFSRGIVEAAELYKEYCEEKGKRESANQEKVMKKMQSSSKPPHYTHIKKNLLHKDCPAEELDQGEDSKCNCKSNSEQPCGDDTVCLNRMVAQECDPAICSAEKRCKNLRFQNREYQNVKVVRVADNRGWGLYSEEPIKKGTFVIEYVGEVIGMEEYRRRMRRNQEAKEECYYYMTIDNDRMIDAGPKGNRARFMNHSCDPNCDTQKWKVNGETRVGLFANKDIPAGQELTFNYCLEAVGDEKKKCLCGASNCSGYIGVKPISDKERKRKEAMERIKKEKLDKKMKKKLAKKNKLKNIPAVDTEKFWEYICYVCSDEGYFDIKCDFKECPKVYHFQCAKREALPVYPNKWKCQWHFCNECGKDLESSDAWCRYCDNSWCQEHKEDNLMEDELLGNICNNHESEIEMLNSSWKRDPKLLAHIATPYPTVPELAAYKTAYKNAHKRWEPYPDEDSDESKVDSADESSARKNGIYNTNSLTEESSCSGSSRSESREPSVTRDGTDVSFGRSVSPVTVLASPRQETRLEETSETFTSVEMESDTSIETGKVLHIKDDPTGEKLKNVSRSVKNPSDQFPMDKKEKKKSTQDSKSIEDAENLENKSLKSRRSFNGSSKQAKVSQSEEIAEDLEKLKNNFVNPVDKSTNSDIQVAHGPIKSPVKSKISQMPLKEETNLPTASDFITSIGKHLKCSNKNCGSTGSNAKAVQTHLKYRNLDNVEVGAGPQIGSSLKRICPELEKYRCLADKENCSHKFDAEGDLLEHCRVAHPARGKIEGAGYKCVGVSCEMTHRFVWGSDQFMQHWKSQHRFHPAREMKYQDLETNTIMSLNDVYPYVGQCIRCLQVFFSNISFEEMKDLNMKHWINDHGLPKNEFEFTPLVNGKSNETTSSANSKPNLEKERVFHTPPKKEVFITPKKAKETAIKKSPSPLKATQYLVPIKKAIDPIELKGSFLCKECEKEYEDSGALVLHSNKVHSSISLADLLCRHVESGRDFLQTALFKYVLECGFEGCFRFYCGNKDLSKCSFNLQAHWKKDHPAEPIENFVTNNIGTEHAEDATPNEDISIVEELDVSRDINASSDSSEYKYVVRCRICGAIRNSNLKFSKARSAITEHLRNKHDQTENFDQSFDIIHNGENSPVYKLPDDLVGSERQNELLEIANEHEVEEDERLKQEGQVEITTEPDIEDARVYNRGQFECLIDKCGDLIQGLNRYMVHFNQTHYKRERPYGPQLDRIVVRYEPENEGSILHIENCFQFLGKCKFKGCNAILGASGRVKDANSVYRFGDGRYEMRRKFTRHYEEQHPAEVDYTIIMEGHKKLWPSIPDKKLTKEQKVKPNLKRKRSEAPKSSPVKNVNRTVSIDSEVAPITKVKIEREEISRMQPSTILRCNYCSKELHGNDSLAHWLECQPSLHISNLIYTNIETCLNVRANEIYSHIGKCTYEQCAHYIGSFSKKVLDLRFKSHYRKDHGWFPENFNTPEHYSIANFINSIEDSTNQQPAVVKDTKIIKRKSSEKTQNASEGIVCLTCDDGTVFSTKNFTRHLNSTHPGQDLKQLQFKRLETNKVVNIDQLLPDKIIGKCNYCGDFNLVNESLGFAVLKGVLLNHYRKFHGEPEDITSCWDYLGGPGGPHVTQESPTLAIRSPPAKKIKRESSILGKKVNRDSFASSEKLTQESSISGERVRNHEGSSQNETFPKTQLSTPAKKTPSKSKPTTPVDSADDRWSCSLCNHQLFLNGGTSPLGHWRRTHPEHPVEAFRAFRATGGVCNLGGIYSHVYRCKECPFICAANKQSNDAKMQMKKHWQSHHAHLMTHGKDFRLESVGSFGYHCLLEDCLKPMLHNLDELRDHYQIHPDIPASEISVRNMDTDQILHLSEMFPNDSFIDHSITEKGVEEEPSGPILEAIDHIDSSIPGLSCGYGIDQGSSGKCSTIIGHGNNGDALRHWQLKHSDKPLKDMLFIDTVTSHFVQFNDMLKLAVVCKAPECIKVVYTNDEENGEKKMREHWAKDHEGVEMNFRTESLENYIEKRGNSVADETFVDFNNDIEEGVDSAEVISLLGDDYDVEVEGEISLVTVQAYKCGYLACPKTIPVEKFHTTMLAQQKLKKHWTLIHKSESRDSFCYITVYKSKDGNVFEMPSKINNILEVIPEPVTNFLEPVPVLEESIPSFLEVVTPLSVYPEDIYHCTEIVKKGEHCKERFMDLDKLRTHWGTAHHVDGKKLEPFKSNIREVDHYACPKLECGFKELNVNAVKRHYQKEHALEGKFQVQWEAAIPPAPVHELEQPEPEDVNVVCLGIVEPCTEEEPLEPLSKMRLIPEVRTCDFNGCTFATYSIRDLEIHKRDMGHKKKRELEVLAGSSGASPYKVYQCKQFDCGYRIGGINLIEEHMAGAHPEVKPEDWQYEEFGDKINNKRKLAETEEDGDLPEEEKKSKMIENYDWNEIILQESGDDSDSDLPEYSVCE